MFGGKSRKEIEDGRELNTILGKGSVIEGKIIIKNSVRVDGRVVGEISSTGTITVGDNGEIEGDITAVRAIVGGKVKGRINASAKAVLEANSVFIGDLQTATLTIDEGAMFEGRCLMIGDGSDTAENPAQKPPNHHKDESKAPQSNTIQKNSQSPHK